MHKFKTKHKKHMLQLIISKHKLSRPVLHVEALCTDAVQVTSILKAMGGLVSVMHTLTRSAGKNQSHVWHNYNVPVITLTQMYVILKLLRLLNFEGFPCAQVPMQCR